MRISEEKKNAKKVRALADLEVSEEASNGESTRKGGATIRGKGKGLQWRNGELQRLEEKV